MPRVPDSPVQTYGQQRVELQPLAGAKLNSAPGPDVFGAQLGDVAERIGTSALSQIWTEQRQRSDQLEVLAADNQLQAWKAKRLYDPQTGALNVKGKDALGLQDAIRPEFDQMVGNIAGTLSNDRQRAAFQQAALATGQHLYETLLQHTDGEMRAYDAEETSKGLDNATNDAIANADTPQRVADALNKQRAIVLDHAKANGLGPEATQALLSDTLTKTHTGVINKLLADDQDRAAQIYYEETKGQINGEAQARIEQALEVGNLRGESQRQSDAIFSKTDSESDALDAARQITDPKLRDAVTQRVQQRWSEEKQAERDDDEQTMKDSANLIDANPRKGVRAIDPATWADLSPGQRTQLESYAKRNAEPGGVKTDWGTYYTLQRFASSDDPKDQEDFANMNLMKFRAQLGNAEFKQLVEAQASARKKDFAGAHQVFATEGVQQQIINQALGGIGVNPNQPQPGKTDYDKATYQRVIDFRRTVRDAVATREARNGGKKLTEPEVQDVVDTLLTPITPEAKHWFSANEPGTYAFEVPGATVTTTAQIPASERRLMEDALQRAGRPVTDAALLGLFNAHLQDVRGRR